MQKNIAEENNILTLTINELPSTPHLAEEFIKQVSLENWYSPLRGPFSNINDIDLNLGHCDFCGKSENTDVISRVPCANCKKVICWECADCGVYGSLTDFQKFIHRYSANGKEVYILAESCPECQETSWWNKYTVPRKSNHAINGEGEKIFQTTGPSKYHRKVIDTQVHKYNLEEVQSILAEALKVAENIWNEKVGIIKGARELTAISHKLNSVETVTDFLVIKAIASETNHLPIGKERELWEESALQAKDIEIKQVENYHKENIYSACRALLEKWKNIK